MRSKVKTTIPAGDWILVDPGYAIRDREAYKKYLRGERGEDGVHQQLVTQALGQRVSLHMDGHAEIRAQQSTAREDEAIGRVGMDTATIAALDPILIEQCGIDIEHERGASAITRVTLSAQTTMRTDGYDVRLDSTGTIRCY